MWGLIGPPSYLFLVVVFNQSMNITIWVIMALFLVLIPCIYAIELSRKNKDRIWFWRCLILFWPLGGIYAIRKSFGVSKQMSTIDCRLNRSMQHTD
jgi:hypothetical protein